MIYERSYDAGLTWKKTSYIDVEHLLVEVFKLNLIDWLKNLSTGTVLARSKFRLRAISRAGCCQEFAENSDALELHDGVWHVVDDDGGWVLCELKYCPFCGTKLPEKLSHD